MGKRSPRAVYSFFSSHHVNSDIFFQFFRRERHFADFFDLARETARLLKTCPFFFAIFIANFCQRKNWKNNEKSFRLIRTKNMSLVSPDKFQHILRVQNTNIDGKSLIFSSNFRRENIDRSRIFSEANTATLLSAIVSLLYLYWNHIFAWFHFRKTPSRLTI